VCSWMRNRSMSKGICSGIWILPQDQHTGERCLGT
jgi:hypothetical protein